MKIKAILSNPLFLGAQGFVVGAALLWSTSEPIDPTVAPVPTASMAAVQLERAAS